MNLQLLRTRHPPEVFLQQLLLLLASEGVDIDENQLRSRIDSLDGKDRLILAVEGEYLYGYAHLFMAHDLINTETAVVASIIVHEDFRRQGIGSLLLAAAETWARQSGQTPLVLRTAPDRTGSHAFFSSMGYEGSATKVEHFHKSAV